MNKLLVAIFMLGVVSMLKAQSFQDDFESYTAGDFIAASSDDWTTWNGQTGGELDVKVVSDQANSGNNSLYLASNDGGPEDLILPFGDKYDIGTLSFEMMMMVESGKGAYFNLQGEEKAGETWVLNFQSSSTGEFELYNDEATVASGSMNNGQWAKLTLVMDLTYNNWTFKLNDEEIATWKNSVNTVASLNLYPVNNMDQNGAGYWVDDISYSYTGIDLSGTNLALLSIGNEGAMLAGSELSVTADIRNIGGEIINAAKLSYSYNGSTVEQAFSDISLSSEGVATVTFNEGITLGNTIDQIEVTILEVNGSTGDDNSADDALAQELEPVIPGANRMVILEEGTGTWCGWCPRGAVSLELLEEKYGDYFQGIAIHSGDPMEVPIFTRQFVDAYIPGFPSGQLNRNRTLSMNPGQSEDAFLTAVIEPSVVSMQAGAELDGSQLTVSVTYTFTELVNEQFTIACALVENNVTGTEDGYIQSNYYANNQNGFMYGWESKPSKVPANQMVYHDVARAVSPSFRGSSSLPAAISKGESFTYQFTFDIDENWNLDEMRIVPLCFKADETIENGASFTYAEAAETGLSQGELIAGVKELYTDKKLHIYPNPTINVANVVVPETGLFEVFDATGRIVISERVKSGLTELNVGTLESGTYLIRFSGSNSVMNNSLVIR